MHCTAFLNITLHCTSEQNLLELPRNHIIVHFEALKDFATQRIFEYEWIAKVHPLLHYDA